MTSYRVRRATLDDLAVLRPVWQSMHLPVVELEKHLTEFQTVEAADGKIVGAVGFHIAEKQGLLHSEAFSDFAAADAARPLLWERFQVLAANHGIFRVWTRESAPFWKSLGFQPANPELLPRLPAAWNRPDQKDGWLTLQLKDEQAVVSMEKELALFMEAEKQRTARMFDQARVLKGIATVLAVGFAIFVLVALILLFRKGPVMFQQHQ
jgi:N-acetylglutamate synthase-like GNAT family acetyltransferase